MSTELTIRRLSGAQVRDAIHEVAALRIAVFRDWPYLYDGDEAYERRYLEAYAKSPRSVFVLACDNGRIVGASTGLPLLDDTAEFRVPFEERGIALGEVFYFGESVLLPAFRGRGLGHCFFDHREAHAREQGFKLAAFCAVDRSTEDARRPKNHRDNDLFWQKRGYQRQAGMTMRLSWKELERGELEHELTFWTRALG